MSWRWDFLSPFPFFLTSAYMMLQKNWIYDNGNVVSSYHFTTFQHDFDCIININPFGYFFYVTKIQLKVYFLKNTNLRTFLAIATDTSIDYLIKICSRWTHDVLRSQISITEVVGAAIGCIGEKTWPCTHETTAATSIRSVRYAKVIREFFSDWTSVELREHHAHSITILSNHANVINIGI